MYALSIAGDWKVTDLGNLYGLGHDAAFSQAAAVWWVSEESAGLVVLALGTKCSSVKAEDPLVLWQLRTVRIIWGTVWFEQANADLLMVSS